MQYARQKAAYESNTHCCLDSNITCYVASKVHIHQALVKALINEIMNRRLINLPSQAKGVEDDGLASASPRS